MELTSVRVPLAGGDRLAVHLTEPVGDQQPLICVPGGPLISSRYLGDLGGLSAHRQLALVDPRGCGGSDVPADPAAYRCDRLAEDIDDVRRHLGLDAIDLLAHSAGANVAYRYLEQHGDQVGRLVLVTPSPFGLGVEVSVEERRDVLMLRRHEPGFAATLDAFERLQVGKVTADDADALGPVFYNRWDEETKAYAAAMDAERNPAAVEEFYEGLDVESARAAAAELVAPTLVLAGEYDVGNPPAAMARLTSHFGAGRRQVLPRSGHFPWRDDPAAFVEAVIG